MMTLRIKAMMTLRIKDTEDKSSDDTESARQLRTFYFVRQLRTFYFVRQLRTRSIAYKSLFVAHKETLE